jgi:hypothetical protein
LLPLVGAAALAGCGGHTRAHEDTAAPAPPVGARFARVVDTFGRHGEPVAVEPDLTGDDVFVAVGHPDLPRPVILLTRRDGDTVVYVYRSPADADAVAAVPRGDLLFRSEWTLLHGGNVLVATAAGRPRRARMEAALAELASR